MIITAVLLACIDRDNFLRSCVGSPLIWNSVTVQNKLKSDRVNYQEESVSPKPKLDFEANSVVLLSFEEAIQIIQDETPKEFIQAVLKSGKKFLYRGEDIVNYSSTSDNIPEKTCFWMNPEPDLLLPGTYEDEKALTYFQNIEKYFGAIDIDAVRGKKKMSSNRIPLPSNSHIGTSNILKAGKWGEPVSIFPLGKNFSYCFPKNRSDFFNEEMSTSIVQAKSCHDEIVINTDLSNALLKKKEVMFSSTDEFGNVISAFVTIPSSFDSKLRSTLFV